MRTNLIPFANKRVRVTGIIGRFGIRRFRSFQQQTVLITDIRDAESGEFLADHVWMPIGSRLRSVALSTNRCIEFSVTVRKYFKNGLLDFKLTHPTEISIQPIKYERGSGRIGDRRAS